MDVFEDRRDAGRRLGVLLAAELEAAVSAGALPAGRAAVVLGLPRGGVPVAAATAAALTAGWPDEPVSLDVLLVRKVGVPGQPELAMGAVGEGGVLVRNPEILRHIGVTEAQFRAAARREEAALERRAARYRAVRDPVSIDGRLAVVVDDGVATGATARAACAVARTRAAAAVVLATPVIARSTAAQLCAADPPVLDLLVTVACPESFGGVGQFYADFAPTSDREVLGILGAASGR